MVVGKKGGHKPKKPYREPVYDNRNVSVSPSKLHAVISVRSWHCKISRIDKGISIDNVKQYIVEQGVVPIQVETLPRRDDAPLSIHVVVPYESKDTIMQSPFLPRGIRVEKKKKDAILEHAST